ncbi:MAG: hypothetical protein WDN06_20305 [Asticcacaulis sp.]
MTPPVAADPDDDPWILATSDHFTVYSDWTEADTVKRIKALEQFHYFPQPGPAASRSRHARAKADHLSGRGPQHAADGRPA